MKKEKAITVGAWAARWFDTRRGGWSIHTQNGYRNLMEHHIIPGIGKVTLGKLTVRRVEGFYKTLAEKGLGGQSIWCVHLLLRRMPDEACRTGQIAFNPAALCKLPQGAAHGILPLRRGQMERYLKAAEGLNAMPLLYIGLTTGLRQCELFTLLWADFDVGQVAFHQGKRTLPLSERAVNLLTEELEHHPGRPEVFLSPKTSAPYRLHEFYYLHKRVIEAAGLDHVRFADLRHTLCGALPAIGYESKGAHQNPRTRPHPQDEKQLPRVCPR